MKENDEIRITPEHGAVPCMPSGDVLRWLGDSGLQTRWAHRLKV
jgi:hypothetical protein